MARVRYNPAPPVVKGLDESDPDFWTWDVDDPSNWQDDDKCPTCRGRAEDDCLTCGGEGYV